MKPLTLLAVVGLALGCVTTDGKEESETGALTDTAGQIAEEAHEDGCGIESEECHSDATCTDQAGVYSCVRGLCLGWWWAYRGIMRELYQVWPSALSSDDVDRISALALGQPSEDGTVFSSVDAMQGIRSCAVRWLEDEWLESLLWPYVEQANKGGFQVAVQRRAEMQFVQYTASQGGHYGWHHDVQWNGQSGLDRKLSVTVQLSSADEYEGGDFEFDELKTNADFRSKGTVLVFPSYLRHRIHPVTSGTRRALVAWFFGPRWA